MENLQRNIMKKVLKKRKIDGREIILPRPIGLNLIYIEDIKL